MKRQIGKGILSVALALAAATAYPCSTVNLPNYSDAVVGKSYDFNSGVGMVVVNKRNVAKTAFVPDPKMKPAKWTSKYGSVTFNQFGREFPNGGMNEKGLVVEIMLLDEAVFPAATASQSVVNEAQWIQYMLDNYASVPEMVTAAPKVALIPMSKKTHYLACDAQKKCASFEWINGKMVVHHNEKMRQGEKNVHALTNSTYADSRNYLQQFAEFGGTQKPKRSLDSLDRFVTVASMSQASQAKIGNDPVAYTLEMLEQVNDPKSTQWQIVYNGSRGLIHFRTKSARSVKYMAMQDFNFGCKEPSVILPIDFKRPGEVSDNFSPYTATANKALLMESVKILPQKFPDQLVEAVVHYPERSTRCLN